MSRLAWLTPEEVTGEYVCFKVYCPQGEEFEAALRGAIVPLCYSFNWELFGAVSPSDAAGEFVSAMQLTTWEQCGNGGSMGIPVGTILWGGYSTPPDHCLVCDGTSLLKAEYPDLFGEIGVAFGSADADHFSLPDLRSRSPIGTGQGTGLTQRNLADFVGEEEHQLSLTEMPQHRHATTMYRGGNQNTEKPASTNWDQSMGPFYTSYQGSSQAHNNMHPSLALTAVIVYESGA
jgi:microcystin-dependent protein